LFWILLSKGGRGRQPQNTRVRAIRIVAYDFATLKWKPLFYFQEQLNSKIKKKEKRNTPQSVEY